MSVVTLVSGGLDSVLMAKLTDECGVEQYPLFLDYGQINCEREFAACCRCLESLGLPAPKNMNVSGFGEAIHSGLTDPTMDVNVDAFTPCRNLLFIVLGAAYAYEVKADAIAIGLLSEENHIFPDQSRAFIEMAEKVIELAVYNKIKVLTPLIHLSKAEVVAIAEEKDITGTYSCHSGTEDACGHCVACLEYQISDKEN